MTGGYLTPPKLAKQWGCSPETVLSLIKSGRLRAYTLSPPSSKRPRWRIPPGAVSEFENGGFQQKPKRVARRQKQEAVTQYF